MDHNEIPERHAEIRNGTGADEFLLLAYQEVCNDYHAVDDFRAKLMGFLPFASIAGILLIGNESVFATAGEDANALVIRIIGYACLFAAFFTLGLFNFEIRGILQCSDLMATGYNIEKRMRVKGLFSARFEELTRTEWGNRIFNAKIAASAIYSLVFASWLFLALKLGFNVSLEHCYLAAVGGGIALAILSVLVIDWLIKTSCSRCEVGS